MYDCFNMAYCDNANAVQLHIKVNSENLIPIPQKYNAGSLRIPADPSWPKIPPRKLADNINDTVNPPCIIKLSGTPRKSRTVIQTPLNHSPKSVATRDSAYYSFQHQKHIPSVHSLEKPPGYTDPRFKKVSNIKRSQAPSIESEKERNVVKKNSESDIACSTALSSTKEIEKFISEKENNTKQVQIPETEKPDTLFQSVCNSESYNKASKCSKNNSESHSFSISQEPKNCVNNTESVKINKITEDICRDKAIQNEHVSKSAMNDANTQVDIASQLVQENNGQLFFLLDKKLQPHSLNAIQFNAIAMSQDHVHQCCNLQAVPVITYQNVPMQISTSRTNNVIHHCSNYKENSTQNEVAVSTNTESKEHINPANIKLSTKQITNAASNYVENDVENDVEEHLRSKEKDLKLDNISSVKSAKNSTNLNIPEKLESTKIQRKQESSDSEYYIPSTIKRSVNRNCQHLKTQKVACNTSGDETTDSEFLPRKNIQKKEITDIAKLATKINRTNVDTVHTDVTNLAQINDQMKIISKGKNEYFQTVFPSNTIINNQDQSYKKSAPYQEKAKNKSEQNLYCTKSECIKKLCRNSEPYITFKQKKASAKFSRKARSYFQKNSHSALIDSDYTLVWPNCQYSKCNPSQTNVHKLSNHRTKRAEYNSSAKLPVNEQNIRLNSNREHQNYLKSDQDIDSCQEVLKTPSKTYLQKPCYKCEASPRSNTDDTIEKKGISLKTQELLNKSYWEYYNKLRHKMKNTGNIEQQYLYQLAMDTEEMKNGKPGEKYKKDLRNHMKLNPELQTLQQCTALSSMINKALDPNLQSKNTKVPSNPITDLQNTNSNKTNTNLTDDSTNKVSLKLDKERDKQFLELKSIIFFGGMMYILIVFLPMLYDYFYHEEYDNYENLSYAELIVEYVLSSFQEAFGDLFNGAKQIFLYPVRLRMT